MNAGCYGGETWDIVAACRDHRRAAGQVMRAKDEFDISYRHCAPDAAHARNGSGGVVRSPTGDGETSRGVIKELLARRIATQPLSLPNAGSVFRNPPATMRRGLIEACGLKGLGAAARAYRRSTPTSSSTRTAREASDIEWLIQQCNAWSTRCKAWSWCRGAHRGRAA
jgi:UDP-N-acetylmuramate dehydrogenase